ncbi:MAG TPA: glycosyltransferase [Actinomycetota bacterium]
MRAVGEARARVAMISLHTSPLDPPGTGDSGGMNVHVRETMHRLADRDVAVDVYTRCAGRGVPEVHELTPLTRVIQVQAGPCAAVHKRDLPELVPDFVRSFLGRDLPPYDVIHAHYWLSGQAARAARSTWGAPLVASFHTLGRVKNASLAPGEPPEPETRIRGEEALIRSADRVVAPTEIEARDLVNRYRARPGAIRVVHPGVDRFLFRPRPKDASRMAWGLEGSRVALFVGRLQPHKGPDVAIRTVAEAMRADPDATRDLVLVLAGGSSGGWGPADLQALARAEGIADRVRFVDSVIHEELPSLYASADVLLVPSRTESFGLAALEAQACGVPVVAASVGGLRLVVGDGESGFLVPGHDPRDHAKRVLRILRSPKLVMRMSAAAEHRAERFPWDRTVDDLLDVYGELAPVLADPDAAVAP